MKKIHTIKADILINASKEEVWDLIFNRFAEVNIFNPLIDGSSHSGGEEGKVGCERHCQIDEKNEVYEKIVARRGNDSMDIKILKGGLPMVNLELGRFDLEVINERATRVHLNVDFTTTPAIMAKVMKGMMQKNFYNVLVGLKHYMETGEEITKDNIKPILRTFKQVGEKARLQPIEITQFQTT